MAWSSLSVIVRDTVSTRGMGISRPTVTGGGDDGCATRTGAGAPVLIYSNAQHR